MVLHAEIAGDALPDIDAIVATIRDVTKLRADVAIRKSGELPNDGKIIDDTRTFT
jgi:phenylacetate-CoA ligase